MIDNHSSTIKIKRIKRKKPKEYLGVSIIQFLIGIVPVIAISWYSNPLLPDLPYSDDGDIIAYNLAYQSAKASSLISYIIDNSFSQDGGWEPIYLFATWLWSNLGFEILDFVWFNMMITIIIFFFLCVVNSRSLILSLIAVIFITNFQLFHELTAIVLRQGYSFQFILLALCAYRFDLKILAIVLFVFAVFTHYSNIFIGIALILSNFTMGYIRYLQIAAGTSLLAYASGATNWVSQKIVIPILFTIELYSKYSDDERFDFYETGFKITWFLATLAAFVLGFLIIENKKPPKDQKIVAITIIISLVFVLMASGVAYYNRLALIPLSLIPLLAVIYVSNSVKIGSAKNPFL